jgi:hypothetical protein
MEESKISHKDNGEHRRKGENIFASMSKNLGEKRTVSIKSTQTKKLH